MFSLPFTLADYTQLSIYYYYVKLHCQLMYLTIRLNHQWFFYYLGMLLAKYLKFKVVFLIYFSNDFS